MKAGNPLFAIEGKPRREWLKKLRSYVALYLDRIEIELDGERDVYTRNDIIDVFIREPVVDGVNSRETVIKYYEKGVQNDYTLEDSTFPGLAEKMELALAHEWSFVAEKRVYPEAVKWFNACCAVVLIAGQQNSAIFGGAYKNPDDIAECREVLYESWQINNRQQLLAMLPKLLNGRAVTIYKAQSMVLDGADAEDVFESFAQSFEQDDLQALQEGLYSAEDADEDVQAIFDAIAQEGGERCLWAWDLQRAIYLSASGYVADFLSWEDALDWCMKAGQKLQSFFSGWDAFMRSYLLGFCLWADERLEDADSEAHERQKIYATYRKLRNNPWAVPWKTALTKML